RYKYYLTPHGFAEKTKLTIEYMSYSFSLFRRAKADCAAALETARNRGFTRIALVGVSDLAEIATICAHDSKTSIVAVIDERSQAERFAGVPVVRSAEAVDGPIDAVLVTDFAAPHQAAERAIEKFGADRVFIPAVLGI